MLLAIETSCDETAVAICDPAALRVESPSHSDFLKADLIASQLQLHARYGGVVPELAAREHLNTLPLLVEEALQVARLSADDISAVAVTRGPGLGGCLMVGVSYAKAFAWARRIPLLMLHHMEGHLFAAELGQATADARVSPLVYPSLALLVSGGHTLLVELSEFRKYRIVAQTRDDAAGEAFDKIATILGLPYPGGPALSRVAESGDPHAYEFPIGVRQDPEAWSFSGLKTAVARVAKGIADRNDTVTANLAASAQDAIVNALVLKTMAGVSRTQPMQLLLTGGVAANSRLRQVLERELAMKNVVLRVPALRWCTDNAAMIAMLGARVMEHSSASLATQGVAAAHLPPDPGYGPLTRWSLENLEGPT